MFCAVIVAAGSSRRAGFDKLAALLDGVPVGYVCVYWNPDHGPFAGTDVPEIIRELGVE